jgi:predicted dehydrogenase
VERVLVGPGAGDFAAFQPGAGIAMGYDDTKVVEAQAFLRSVADGRPYGAGVVDALRAAELVEALADSSSSRRWVELPRT